MKVEFKGTNLKAFSAWLKRFKSISNSVLIEVDDSTQEFLAKQFNDEKSIVKFSSISFEEAGFEYKLSDKIDKRIKVGLYDITALLKIFDNFSGEDFTFTINFDEIQSKSAGKELAGKDLVLKSGSLRIKAEATSLNIFKYLPDNIFKDRVAQIDPDVEFEISSDQIDKINSLCALEKSNLFLKWNNKEGNMYVTGETFEYLIQTTNEKEISLLNLKDQFYKIDSDSYVVKINEDKIVFKTVEGENFIVFSKAVKGDYDD